MDIRTDNIDNIKALMANILDGHNGENLYAYLAKFNSLNVGYVANAKSAREAVPEIFRKNGLYITYYINNKPTTEIFIGDKTVAGNETEWIKDEYWEFSDGIGHVDSNSITLNQLSKEILDLICANNEINIVNYPDGEDLTEFDVCGGNSKRAVNALRFADKDYNPANFSGLGRVYLRKNIVNIKQEDGTTKTINLLTQDMINKENTEYIIQYDYDLNGKEITIPNNCIIDFKNNNFKNGTIQSNKTKVINFNYNKNIFKGIFYTINGKRLNKYGKVAKDYIDCVDPILPYGQYAIDDCITTAINSGIDKMQIIYYLQINNNVITTTDNFAYWKYYTVKDIVDSINKSGQTLYSLKFHKNINFNDDASEEERTAYKNYVLSIVDEYKKYTNDITTIYISNEEHNRTKKGNDWNITHKELITELHNRGYKVGISCNVISTTFTEIDSELVNMLDYIGINFYPCISYCGFDCNISDIPKYINNATNELKRQMNYIYKINPNANIQITESGCMPYEYALSKPYAWEDLGEKDTTGIIRFIFYTVSLVSSINCGINIFHRWFQDDVDYQTELNYSVFNKYLFT